MQAALRAELTEVWSTGTYGRKQTRALLAETTKG